MCGLVGFKGFKHLEKENVPAIAKRMGDAIHHRGPDGSGIWHDHESQIALVHQRLSIVDLSPAGHQPMVSHSSRYVIIFNGEIYNHLELRKKIEDCFSAINWRGHSDTETLLTCIDHWGLEDTLHQCVGMFAFALWDKHKQTLYLARDRMGEKPLYYGNMNGVFLFGSELKALKVHPAFSGNINRDSISLQLRRGYIPAPYSIYHGIYKLQPGHILQIKPGQEPELFPYWSLRDAVLKGQANVFEGSDADAVNTLEQLLVRSVQQQMLADVPLGAFLSGGIDSSTIVALMQAQSDKPVKTFSIGFNEAGFNEAEYAKAVAAHLGTEHTELYVSSQKALDVIPALSSIYDEPFSDSSQIPTYIVSMMTKQHVTVALSGDGGDELFGGYNRYMKAKGWWDKIQKIPLWLRHISAAGLRQLTPAAWDHIGRLIAKVHGDSKRWNNLSHLMPKLAGVLSVNNGSDLYRHFVSHWTEPLVYNSHGLQTQLTCKDIEASSIVELMMALDTVSYLPDDILCKVDRAAMACSLETRVPMLDHRIIEFAWQLPLSMKIRNGQGKWILRQVLDRYVPKTLIHRPKMGFGVPIDSWLRGPLRDWAENLLNESRLKHEGFLNHIPIQQKWKEHLSGRNNWQYHLWDVLMFQAWLEKENEEKAKGAYINQHHLECV